MKRGASESSMSDLTASPRNLSRRFALVRGGWWLTTLVLGGVLYPLARFVNFTLPKQPVHLRVDKTLAVGGFHIDKNFILFLGEKGPWAVSRKCTHLGCSVSYDESQKKLVCPCHHSKFSVMGVRLEGPARKNLKTFAVEPLPKGQKGFIVTV